MTLADLIDEKSRIIVGLEAAKRDGLPPDQIRRLANQAADLEREIAGLYLRANDVEKAVVNFISEASCLVDAGATSDAIRVYRSVISRSPTEKLKRWVQMQIDAILDDISRRPASSSSGNEYRLVERPFLDQLHALGWEVIDQGPGIPHDPVTSRRSSFRDVALKRVFCESIRKINLTVDGEERLTGGQLEELYERLTQVPGHSLLEANQQVFRHLLKTQVDANELTGEQYPEVKLIDFEHSRRNQFLAINQFRIDTPGQVKNFIIPGHRAVRERPAVRRRRVQGRQRRRRQPAARSFLQLMRYSDQREETRLAGLREGEPRLFHFNQLLVRTTGERPTTARSRPTEEEFFSPWNDIYPETYRTYSPPLGKERAQETTDPGDAGPGDPARPDPPLHRSSWRSTRCGSRWPAATSNTGRCGRSSSGCGRGRPRRTAPGSSGTPRGRASR